MMQPPTNGVKGSFAHKLSAGLLAGMFVVEASIFYWTVIRNIVPYYPINSDQTSYYLDTYSIIHKGWLAVVGEYMDGAHATGVGFTAAGAMLGLIFGASRTVIVSLNLICFLALQFVQFRIILDRTRRLEFAWLSIALLISSQTIFNGAGGIYDFRIDFSAFCFYGIWVYSILWSDIFRNSSRSLIVALAAILLISFRYLTVLYVAATFGGLLIVFIWSMLKRASSVGRDVARLRARNLIVVGILILLIIGPLLFSSRLQIYNYYVVGHVIGEERYIRAHMLGLFTLMDHLLYYPKSIYREHVGQFGVVLAAFIFAVAGAFIRSPLSKLIVFQRLKHYGLDLTVLGFSCVFPIVVLTADIAKSSVVVGIIVAPIVGLCTFLCAIIWQGRTSVKTEQAVGPNSSNGLTTNNSLTFRQLGVIATAMIALGCFATRGLTPPDGRPASDLRRVTEINDVIDRYLIQHALPQPSISIDRVTDYLNLGTVILFGFERYHKLINLSPHFGHSIYGIFAVPRDVALKLFKESDIIVLTDPTLGRTGYPTDKKIVEYWDEVNAWTRMNRTLIYSSVIFGVPHAVYVRNPISSVPH